MLQSVVYNSKDIWLELRNGSQTDTVYPDESPSYGNSLTSSLSIVQKMELMSGLQLILNTMPILHFDNKMKKKKKMCETLSINKVSYIIKGSQDQIPNG